MLEEGAAPLIADAAPTDAFKNRIGVSIIVVCAVMQGGAALQGKKMGNEGLRREHRMRSLEIDMTPVAGACT